LVAAATSSLSKALTVALKRDYKPSRSAIRLRHNAKMEDVASVAQAAIVKRDWDALQPLLHPYLHWMQADGQVVRGRTNVIGMLQAIGISGAPASVELRDGQVYRWYV
jgi:hypothetical protein